MNSFRVGLGASLFAGLVALPASAAQSPGAAGAAPAAVPAAEPAPAAAPAAAAEPGAAPAAEPTPEGPAAGGTVSIGTEGAAADGTADGGSSGGFGMGGTKRASGDKCQDDKSKKWIRRCKPEKNMFELGIFGGVMFPASGLLLAGQEVPGIPSAGDGTHELFNAEKQREERAAGREFWKPYQKAAPEIGLRFAWYPLSFLGGEIEGGVMPTRVVDNGAAGDRATLFNFRGHFIAQLPFWRIAPFVLVGGGMLGTAGALGSDIDPATHFGGGVKLYLTHRVMMRLDIRDVIAAKKEVDNGATHYPEILLGLSLTLNRPKKPVEPDKDSDGDGFLDKSDACPYEPGIAPDGCPERDRDGDGFMDSQDACPDVPGIAPDGCPEKDRDGDGFLDSVDKCPDDPGVEPDGCPIPDTDGDGILDPDDKCPLEPENKNGYQDEDGCPDVIPAKIAAFTGTIKGIYFDLDKSTIKPKSRPVLDRAVSVLQEFDSIRIEISGHTDSTGSPDYNRKLSLERANAVKTYLTEHGVATARIETRGAGPDEPIDTNKTAAGRAKNRRIEFTILVQ
jgi:outer membrane protein OmpA-like peptidoglycan-associated protein